MDHNEGFDLKKRLVEKSIEAYVLALETINRLTIQYRLETFCYLICNAWELLLKAKILEDEGRPDSIYYKEQHGRSKRSLSLRDCLRRTMSDQRDPVRRNIERIEELRDESVHLVINQIPSDVICLFQAGVINYHKCLNEWFGESLSDRFPVGMMSIVYDMNPGRIDLSDQRLSRKLGSDTAEFLTRYCAELKQEFDRLQRPAEFSIEIDYHLLLTNRPNEADTELSSGPTNGGSTQIVEVAKDASKSHPFRRKEVIEEVKVLGIDINQYDIQCIIKAHGVKNRSEYFYQGKIKGSPGQYSQTFIDWLAERYRQDSEFFQKARMEARENTN